MNEIEILKELIERCHRLKYKDNSEVDDIRRKGKMILENLFPLKTYSIDILSIQLRKGYGIQMDESYYRQDWEEGKQQFINLFDTVIHDYELNKNRHSKQELIKERIIRVTDETA